MKKTFFAVLAHALPVCLCLAGSFPRWRGEYGNGSAGDPGVPLVKSWAESRVAWVSEIQNPHPWNYSVVRGRAQWPRTVLGNGGYCMPAVHDGKVYVAFWRGSGKVEATDGDGKYKKLWVRSEDPRLTLILADMVVACMDAWTGRTVWETVFKEKEMNHSELYGCHNNLCISNGKVFAFGNAGWVYCVDAKSGKKQWESPIGLSTKIWDRYKEKCLKEKLKGDRPSDDLVKQVRGEQGKHPEGGSLHSQTYNMCLVVAGNVLVAGDWSAGPALVGFDVESGKQLWRNGRLGGGVVPPLLWKHKDQEYLICGGGAVQCVDPKTGKVLWGVPAGASGYNQATPAIDGDLLVTHGPWHSQRKGKVGADKLEGWLCFEMSPEGAKKKWSLGGAHLGTTYIAPVIHNGYAYLLFSRDKNAKPPKNACDISARGTGLACVDMKTGKVMSEIGDVPIESTCPGMVGMGDKLVYLSSKSLWLVDANPKEMESLGVAPQFVNYCSSPTAADGFVYFRSGERLVTAIDLRAPSSRLKPSKRHDDPKNALYEFTVSGARSDGKDIRFFMRGRDGRFHQSWVETLAPGYHYPDVFEAEGLVMRGDSIKGKVGAYVQALRYKYEFDLKLGKDGVLTGKYVDLYRGVPLEGEVKGKCRPQARKNGKFTLSWHRMWCGSNASPWDFKMFMDLENGKFKNTKFEPRDPKQYDVSIIRNDLKFDGEKWTGTLKLEQKKSIKGIYTLTFDVPCKDNRLRGKVTSRREGGKAQTWDAWGEVDVPETEPGNAENGIYEIWIDKCIPTNPGLYTWFRTEKGKVLEENKAWIRGCAGTHPSDPRGLSVKGTKLTGLWVGTANGDGYALKDKNIKLAFELDAEVKDGVVTGTYKGYYDSREPKQGEIVAGIYRNE
ncbi:PQQ-binding-like beta-propeller repeat protein [Verrucomicrobiota bacterium]